MSDLNDPIARWKAAVAAKGACSPDELDELESHLREDVAAGVAAGLSGEEALSRALSRLGDTDKIGREFAKNEQFVWDAVALRANLAVVALAGLAAVAVGAAAWMKRGDALLAAHVGTVLFAYLIPFLLALLGTYAVFRAAAVKQGEQSFNDRFARRLRLLLAVLALGCGVATILGGIWARRHWGRFWGWDPKEVGALSVVVCATALYLLVTRYKPGGIRLGQAGLVMGLVTSVAWFGPAVYAGPLSGGVLAVLGICLAAQLAVLVISLLLPGRRVAQGS
jgi:hypothetical protein